MPKYMPCWCMESDEPPKGCLSLRCEYDGEYNRRRGQIEKERGEAVSTEPFDEPVAQNTASRVAPDPLPDPDAQPEEYKKYILKFKEEAIKAIQETAVGAVNAAVVRAAVNTVRVAGKSKDLVTV